MYDEEKEYPEINSYKRFKKHVLKPFCKFLKRINKTLLEDNWFLGRYKVRLYSVVQSQTEKYLGMAYVLFIDDYNPLNNYLALVEVAPWRWHYEFDLNKQLNSWIIWCGDGRPGDSPSSIHMTSPSNLGWGCDYSRICYNIINKYENWKSIPKNKYNQIKDLFSENYNRVFDAADIPDTILNSWTDQSGNVHNITSLLCPSKGLDFRESIDYPQAMLGYDELPEGAVFIPTRPKDFNCYVCFVDNDNKVHGVFRRYLNDFFITMFEKIDGKRYDYVPVTYKITDIDSFYETFDSDKSFRAYCILLNRPYFIKDNNGNNN